MRRSSYHQKTSKPISKSNQKPSLQHQARDLNFPLEMMKLSTQHPEDERFTIVRPNRYSYMYKQPIKLASYINRPHTTQRSNSLNEIAIKKQEHDISKPNSTCYKNHKQAKDLWVSTAKDYARESIVKNYSQLHQNSLQKGKIHRGVSFKGDERSFLNNFLSNPKKYYPSNNNSLINQNSQRAFSSSNSKKNGAIDLIGKNLQKSMPAKCNDDDFFEYVMRFSYKTKKGYSPSNPKKINQDSYITNPNINGKTWQHLFGICDGHGPLGHLVSGFIKSSLPQCIGNLKNIQKNPTHTLNKGFQNAYQKLLKQSHVDMSFSGSTVIVCYFLQNKLYCCNVGDSRAIMGKNKGNQQWTVIPLSTDHKPCLVGEAERIRKMKGRIQAYKDEFGQEIGPLRVWLKKDNVPGLAMSRSFGDLVAASVGVSHQPQIKQFTLTQQDKIVLIASDGVFEFLGNEELIKELVPYYQKKQIQQASEHLLGIAHRSWNKNSSIIDDITFILIFMNYGEI